MRSPLTTSLRLSAAVVVAALALTACGSDPADNAVDAAPAVPSPVASAVKTDVGQFLVKPKEGTSKTVVEGTIAKLKSMPGVESVALNADGFVDVVIVPLSPQEQRNAIVQQMAGLGEVIEGI